MSIQTEFLIYCIEEYKYEKHLSGKQVILLFNQYHISEYITRHYDALHTTGGKYIVSDIDEYIKARA